MDAMYAIVVNDRLNVKVDHIHMPSIFMHSKYGGQFKVDEEWNHGKYGELTKIVGLLCQVT